MYTYYRVRQSYKITRCEEPEYSVGIMSFLNTWVVYLLQKGNIAIMRYSRKSRALSLCFPSMFCVPKGVKVQIENKKIVTRRPFRRGFPSAGRKEMLSDDGSMVDQNWDPCDSRAVASKARDMIQSNGPNPCRRTCGGLAQNFLKRVPNTRWKENQ